MWLRWKNLTAGASAVARKQNHTLRCVCVLYVPSAPPHHTRTARSPRAAPLVRQALPFTVARISPGCLGGVEIFSLPFFPSLGLTDSYSASAAKEAHTPLRATIFFVALWITHLPLFYMTPLMLSRAVFCNVACNAACNAACVCVCVFECNMFARSS